MAINKARLLIRVANEVTDSEDKSALLQWADEILSGTQTTTYEAGNQVVKFPIDIFRRYKQMIYPAKLLPGWKIEFNGETFSSPSPAAHKISGKTENGWLVWRYIDEKTGEEYFIDSIRNNLYDKGNL